MLWLLQIWNVCYACILFLKEKSVDNLQRFITLKCIHFTDILWRLFVYILLTFYVLSRLLFSKILYRLRLMVWSPCLFFIVISQRKWQDFASIWFNKIYSFYKHYLNFSAAFCKGYLCRFYCDSMQLSFTEIIWRFCVIDRQTFVPCLFFTKNIERFCRDFYIHAIKSL